MTITTRASKGSALTHNEMDENFTDLRDGAGGRIFSKGKNDGIKIDKDTPLEGWHDLNGIGYIDPAGATNPHMASYVGNIKEFQFTENDNMFVRFHMPHDYLMGSEMFIHVHWSHISSVVTGGSCTWAFETTYSKGHNQAEMSTLVTCSIVGDVNTIPYQHLVSETSLSVSGGSGTQLDTDDLEVDGMILCNFYLDSNDLTTSDASTVEPFVHFVDIHYQSTGIPTKGKAPDFWT